MIRISRYLPAIIIGIATLGLAVLHTNVVHADGPAQAITLSPASTDVSINAGDSVSKTFDVINSGADPFLIALSTSPYYVTSDSYDPHFTQLPGTVDPSGWVGFSPTSTTVGSNSTLTIPYTITVPKNTPAGGYYAVVFAQTSTDNAKTGVVSHNRVGNILYITVNGTIKTGGAVTGSQLPSFSFAGSIPMTTKISNTGGTHFITTAVDSVTDFTGNKVFTASTERYVLPQTEREITSNWSPQFVFGIFTIHRTATVAGTLQALPDQKIVIVNPWVFVAVTFFLGILIAVPIHRARRRRSA